ncbi:hypothetical protein CPB83DRAFT_756801 [Crepidotus variabilis]|uniref:Nitrogen regulatory protein areA GATA-like domain-containing protein n=1 Tax=Crepidotus variabilis TaxID=179855 RepID=A0A9P6EQ69_9AGAR|nr:hypothetical protein CPB83DRAFT_756801 [Crepidotus variabilis]
MVTAFTTPILSVAADAVRDLDGREALSGLWAVFTKCKGSLQNGPRLENIAWRLWHQEMKGSNRESIYVCEDRTLSEKDVYDEKSAYRPPTPSEILNLPPPYPELPSAPAAASSLPAGGVYFYFL